MHADFFCGPGLNLHDAEKIVVRIGKHDVVFAAAVTPGISACAHGEEPFYFALAVIGVEIEMQTAAFA